MGSSQSKLPEPFVQEKLAERLQALEIQENHAEGEKEYVYVGKEEKTPIRDYSPTLSISAAEQWEKELLQDPKVNRHRVSSFEFRILIHIPESSRSLRIVLQRCQECSVTTVSEYCRYSEL